MNPAGHAIRIGCAGWSIPRQFAPAFPGDGTHLERYAQQLPAVEINSSFYHPHQAKTYARWAASVPASFQFAVKLPREITHTRRLIHSEALLEPFLDAVSELGPKLGPLLVQLPPSLRFDPAVDKTFFAALRSRFSGTVVCEPRHASWFTANADQLLRDTQIARVAADPAPVAQAALPGGWPGFIYYRLHGSPEMYVSSYTEAYLIELGHALENYAQTVPTWCIFDNTALGAAMENACYTLETLYLVESGENDQANQVKKDKSP